MIIDMAAHILPPRYAERISGADSPYWEDVPALVDLDLRLGMIELYAERGYRQILSVAVPPPETVIAPADLADGCSRLNEELAQLAAAHPDHFAGAMGHLPLGDPAATEREIGRIRDLGLVGFQCYTDFLGRPLDDPAIAASLDIAFASGLPGFLHPAGEPLGDYAGEDQSKFGLWRTFGWPYATTIALSRLAFSGAFERVPDLKLIAHHGGAMIPFFEGRMPGRLFDDMKKIYVDTAVSGSVAAATCAIDFFGADRVLFGSDTPFGPGGGRPLIEGALALVERVAVTPDQRRGIESANSTRLFGL